MRLIFVRPRRPIWWRVTAFASWCVVAYVALSALSLGRVVWSFFE
ncbi:hypothetical protein [Chitinimonas lacunae]|uniref:DUF2474 family protein n=1 Tax=Chitinimonas lacunae TaxID=1963018 RepID=A0ABV8MJB7_9NEIS